jgi:hypothetical protein
VIGFASDALYDFDASAGELRATICRASRYADDVNTPPITNRGGRGRRGELRFKFLIARATHVAGPARASWNSRRWRFSSRRMPAKLGDPDRSRNCSRDVQTPRPQAGEDGKGLILRVQETAGGACKPKLTCVRSDADASELAANRIATWRLQNRAGLRGWSPTATDAPRAARLTHARFTR